MQPERKIEKLLRAYAKRRKAAAGDSFALPPATRRRLQEEVVRRARKQEGGEGTWLSIWLFLRQRWVFSTASVLALVLGVVLVLPALTSSKPKPRFGAGLAMKSPAPARAMLMTPPAVAPAPVAMPTDNLALPPGNPPTEDRTRRVISGETNYEPPNVALDVPMTATTPESESFKKNVTGVVAGSTFALQKKSVQKDASSGVGGTAGALSGLPTETMTDAIQYRAVVTNSIQLADVPAFRLPDAKETVPSSSYQNVAASAKASMVLTRFKVIQNGNDIQIVDYDGSVYRGSWQPKVAQNTVNQALQNGNSQISEPKAELPAGAVQWQVGGAAVQTASRVYSVKVTGNNRTLKQKVVFSGDLSVVLTVNTLANNSPAPNDALQNATANTVSTGLADNSQNNLSNGSSQQSLWQNSFIVGKAVVAGTNQVEINAISVAP